MLAAGVIKPLAADDNKITYLALGDSVAFGLNVDILPPPPFTAKPPQPSAFIGYPEVIAGAVKSFGPITEINSSCPGETSGSFITGTAPDYGCYSKGPQGQPAFFSWVGLKVNYKTSQLAYAVSELPKKKYNLVTLQIGSNDVLLLLAACNQSFTNPVDVQNCVNSGLATVLPTYAANLAKILGQVRSVYTGTLVLVGYYSPQSALDPVAVALNTTMKTVGSNFGVTYADGFAAFEFAEALAGHPDDPCTAGLLVKLPAVAGGGCDIHPSLAGSDVLAAAVMTAVGTSLLH